MNYIFSVLKKEFIQYLFFSGYFPSAEFDPDGSFVAIGVGGIVGSRVLWSFLATSAVSCPWFWARDNCLGNSGGHSCGRRHRRKHVASPRLSILEFPADEAPAR